ncbi:unnamed protein product, partial [Rotaria sp. Silwood2]
LSCVESSLSSSDVFFLPSNEIDEIFGEKSDVNSSSSSSIKESIIS